MSPRTGALGARIGGLAGGLGHNVAANMGGMGWTAVAQLAVLPVYLRLLGPEAFGLIGFYAAVMAVLQALDLGLSPTLNRELARRSLDGAAAGETRDLVRTIEVGYWALGLLLGAGILAASGWLAGGWFRAAELDPAALRRAVALMGVMAALQWPLTLYHGGLMGLQRQVAFNVVKVGAVTLLHGGGVLVLLLGGASVERLFGWHAAVYGAQALVLRLLLWRSLPRPAAGARGARVRLESVRGVYRFALGVTGVAVTGLLFAQADRVVLSRLLPLETFGYYALAAVAATGLNVLSNPFYYALFPRFAQHARAGNRAAVAALHRTGVRALSAVLLPAALVLALFAGPLVAFWTGSAEAAAVGGPILRWLAVYVAASAFGDLFSAVQLAHGWTSIGVRLNSAGFVIAVPALTAAAIAGGPAAAAAALAVTRVALTAASFFATYRRILAPDAPGVPGVAGTAGAAGAHGHDAGLAAEHGAAAALERSAP
jgi:O-antigen/teichoic acid export membrane protein